MSVREVAERLRKRRQKEAITTEEGTLYVRGLSGTERQTYMSRWSGKIGAEALLADQHLVAMAMCDEAGAPLYESEDEAFEVTKDWAIADVGAAAQVVLKLSGLAAESSSDAEKKS